MKRCPPLSIQLVLWILPLIPLSIASTNVSFIAYLLKEKHLYQ